MFMYKARSNESCFNTISLNGWGCPSFNLCNVISSETFFKHAPKILMSLNIDPDSLPDSFQNVLLIKKLSTVHLH